MLSTAALVLVYLAATTDSHDINYCGAKMCGYTNAHTLCQFSNGPSPSCTGLLPAALEPDEKTSILARLNRRRNDAAGGRLKGLPSAGNMLKLRWVEELAREAQLWADQCRPQRTPEEHDACRDLYAISVGQCVASVVGESPGLRVESMVDIWFMQNKFFKGNVTLYEPPELSKYFYGDFAQIVWARSFMVGCGRSRFMLPVNGRLRTIERLVCNFAPQGPVPYRPLWTLGVPATACPSRSRPSEDLTSLCDYQNEFNQVKDIDASMTIEDHILLNALLERDRNDTLFDGSLDEIYLTYLAIVTMQNTDATTLHSNSMQKRDIDNKIYSHDSNSKEKDIARQFSKLETIQDNTTNPTKKLLLKKTLKTIGRPKAYKMEELSNTRGDHKDMNHDMTEGALKRNMDYYYDYNTETIENITIPSIATEQKLPEIKDSNVAENYTFEDHTYEIVPMPINTTTTVAFSGETELYGETKLNTDEKVNAKNIEANWISTTATEATKKTMKEKTVDEYLSDSETVHQLQEALDHMEHEACTVNNITSSTRKTRRDVQDADVSDDDEDISNAVSPLPDDYNFTLLGIDDISSTPSPDNSSETPPVLSMMLKYMPYLKHYESEMMRSQNSANCFGPSLVMIMVVLHA